ncbi:MAG: hypothetical protein ACOY94_16790 [Bacillota bacterium]
MALPDWILGVLFRPGETFERARTEMTYSYWWILLSVFTIEAVMMVNDPVIRRMVPTPSNADIIYNWAVFLLLIFTFQGLCFFGAGRLFGWAITWSEALKYTGLTWALFLLEDMVTFYPFLREQRTLLFWVSLPFIVWRIGVQTAGVRRLAGRPAGVALAIVLVGTLPWQLPLLYLSWTSLFQGS